MELPDSGLMNCNWRKCPPLGMNLAKFLANTTLPVVGPRDSSP